MTHNVIKCGNYYVMLALKACPARRPPRPPAPLQGQAAYLIAHPEGYTDPFWMSIPRPAFWPMLVVATLASIVASQALNSGCMSIMRQAMMLGVLPSLRVDHTSDMVEGQIYIGQVRRLQGYCIAAGASMLFRSARSWQVCIRRMRRLLPAADAPMPLCSARSWLNRGGPSCLGASKLKASVCIQRAQT